MASQREVALETGAEKRFKALWRAVEGGSAAPARAAAGVTDNGRYAYRYDDEGRFHAVRLPDPGPVAFDDCPR